MVRGNNARPLAEWEWWNCPKLARTDDEAVDLIQMAPTIENLRSKACGRPAEKNWR
jgi:hypothetical protein